MDKKTWGPGPWQEEFDLYGWTDPLTGKDCRILRNYGGALCGYVAINKHLDYNDNTLADIGVHGGLTFDGHLLIDHDDQWWLGFDCAHSGDNSPAHAARCKESGFDGLFAEGTYKNLAYVKNEVLALARQLDALGL